MPALGRVVAIFRYPVKSMAGEELPSASFGEYGVPGDRGWALRSKDGRPCSAKRLGELMRASARFTAEPAAGAEIPPAAIAFPDGSSLTTSDPDAASRLSDWLGEPLRLLAAEGLHFDAHPVHLLTTASLKTMERLSPASRWDVRRFRPNLLVEPLEGGDAHEGFPELGWTGDLRVGKAEFLFKKPTKRCVMTSLPQDDLPADPAVLQALVDHADAAFGIYAVVLKPGRVAVGDLVERL